ALAASGQLSRKVGGPSVYPPQPEGIYRFTQVPREWKPSEGADRYRRGLYTHFWRSAPHPGLTVFDAPDATTACTRRNRSNTPLRPRRTRPNPPPRPPPRLTAEASVEGARAPPHRVLREPPPRHEERVRYAFRLCLGRPPNDREEERLLDLLNQLTTGDDGTP